MFFRFALLGSTFTKGLGNPASGEASHFGGGPLDRFSAHLSLLSAKSSGKLVMSRLTRTFSKRRRCSQGVKLLPVQKTTYHKHL